MREKVTKMCSRLLALVLCMTMLSGCASNSSKSSTEADNSQTDAATSAPAATTAPAQTTSEANSTITMAIVSAWDTMIPFDTTSAYSDSVFDLIYDKLVYLKADGTYYSRLADKWEMNADNTVLTVHLNENAKWQDGEPVTAEDVVFTSKLYSSPTLASVRMNQLSPVKGFGESDDSLQVEAVDEHTVTFTLTNPTNIDFLMFTKFRDLYILPSHLLKDIPYDQIRDSDFWENPVGSGSCVYESQISGERMEFTANENYFLGAPEWDRFVVRVVTTSNLLSGLMNGEIDVLAGGQIASLQLSDWDMAQQQTNLTCLSTETVSYQYMAINTSRDYLPDKVRQAINMAIDRSLIVDGLLKGEGVIGYGPIPSSSQYYNPEIEAGYDPDQAKELLKEAGWDGSHELIMSVPTGNVVREQSAVVIQQCLEAVGIKVKIESADFATHLTRVRDGDYDLGLIGSGGSPDPSECVINFNPDHMNNFSHLSDWTIYNTGAEGESAFTVEDRKVCYDKYQVLIKEQVPFAFLYYANALFAYNNRIEGITDSQDFSQINRNVWEWKIK